MNTNDYYTREQAAKLLGVTKQRVSQLVRAYDLTVVFFGSMRLIPKKELRKLPKNRNNRTRIAEKK
jgi:excisionase family DNA binding protein